MCVFNLGIENNPPCEFTKSPNINGPENNVGAGELSPTPTRGGKLISFNILISMEELSKTFNETTKKVLSKAGAVVLQWWKW